MASVRGRSGWRWPGRIAFGLLLLIALAAGLGWWRLDASKPRLDGELAVAGLSAPVTITRDANGVPTLTGANRADLAFALGYLHGQERFFQMDLLRRAGAGELSALLGAPAEAIDRKLRLHRFRARALAELARTDAGTRGTLVAYAAGVNRGLRDLRAAPFEYAILRQRPEPWSEADSLLTGYALFFDLQGPEPSFQMNRARASARVGQAMANVLYPQTTELDSPIDGSRLPEPPLPAAMGKAVALGGTSTAPEPMVKGSNNWAVAGRLSATGAAMIADDMHLAHSVPNIWYRARMRMPGWDAVGVTLPGNPHIVVGSNGRIAWGFTNSYAALHDAVAIDPVPGRPGMYATPDGPRAIGRVPEKLCVGGRCSTLMVEETIWGPIVGTLPDGRRVADRWIAHDPGAVHLAGPLALERAGSVAEAIRVAHQGGIPDQNLTVGDREGNIGWTIFGRLPARFGLSGRDAASWADGKRGWAGYLPPERIPAIINPPSGRIWTANARVVGGAAYTLIGDGGYDNGARAGEIAARLAAKERFAERDLLAIQLDDTSLRNRFWAEELLRVLARTPARAAWIQPVQQWNGRADAGSVGYRLIAQFRRAVITQVMDAYVGPDPDGRYGSRASGQTEGGIRRLLRARPPALVPPGYANWDALEAKALDTVAADIDKAAGGDLARYTWGAYMHPRVQHPLAKAIGPLGWLTDPADPPTSGDAGTPRAQYPGGGQSERMVVSPGHEARALFHMPGGQSGNPLSPYYLAGHTDWLEGRPTPLLPGATLWTLTLVPARGAR